MKIEKINEKKYTELVTQASQAIKAGGVIILPFDTVYGFACDPRNNKALEKIFKLKERDLSKTIGLAVGSIETLETYATLDEKAKEFIKEKTPGKFTFILPVGEKAGTISPYCKKNNTIGIRIPDSQLILDIIKESGGIIAQTSANKSGQPNCYSIEEIKEQYTPKKLDQADLVIDGGNIGVSAPSQILDFTHKEIEEIQRT